MHCLLHIVYLIFNMADINTYAPMSGRAIKENGSIINLANVFAHVPIEIARGHVPGAEIFTSFGELITTGPVINHIIWPLAGTPNISVPMPSGVQMSLMSTSAEDSAAGSGIQQIAIHYLDSNLIDQEEIVTLNGITPVLTVATNIRHIQCMHMHVSGSGKTAVGTITASNGGNVYSLINAGIRRCTSSVRRVPAGKKAYITALVGGASSGTSAAKAMIKLVSTEIENHKYDDDGIMYPLAGISIQDSSEALNLSLMIPFTAGTLIGLECDVDKSATITGGFIGWIEDA